MFQDLVVRHTFVYQDIGAPSSVPQKPEKIEKDHLSTAVSHGSDLTPENTIFSVFKNSYDGKSRTIIS